jgi:Kef-type K+ transport system membrane component KefB
MNTRVGQIALSAAALDDVSAWCLLAVIAVIARPEGSGNALPLRFLGLGVYVLAMLLVVRPVLRRLLPASERPGPGRFAGVMILLLASVWTTEALAVHALFGAFLAGAAMPGGGLLETGLRERLESVTVALLLPLFSMMVIMALATTVMTSPLMDWIYPERLRSTASVLS